MLPLALRRLLRPVKHLAEPWRQNSWFEAARSKFARPVGYPPLTDDLRRRLSEYYAYDVAELSKMLGRDMGCWLEAEPQERSEEHTSELQSLMRISYAVFCSKKKKRPDATTECRLHPRTHRTTTQ